MYYHPNIPCNFNIRNTGKSGSNLFESKYLTRVSDDYCFEGNFSIYQNNFFFFFRLMNMRDALKLPPVKKPP